MFSHPRSLLVRLLAFLLPTVPALTPRPAAALPQWRLVLLDRGAGTQSTSLAPPRVTMPNLGEGPVVIEAPELSRERANSPILARGGVTLTQGDARLTAEQLTADPDTGEVLAEGNVVFTEPGRTLRGRQLTYNTDTRRVRATEIETVVKGLIVRARSVDADPSRYTAARASITTCDLPRPHYRLTARTVVLEPDNQIVARHVGVWLLGVRLFVVPRLSGRIGTARGEGSESLFPRIGRNGRDGLFLARVLPLVESPRLYLDLDARLSERRGLTGGFDAATPLGQNLQLIGALKYRDEAPNQRSRFLEVDRIPEVGILWVSPAPRAAARRAPRPRRSDKKQQAGTTPATATGATTEPQQASSQSPSPAAPVLQPPAYVRPLRQVGSDVAHQPGLLRPPERHRWYLRAQSTVGLFHQREQSAIGGEAENLTGGRLDFRATASHAGLRLFGLSLPVFQLFFRQSYYDTGNSFSVFGFAVRQDWRMGPHWASGLKVFLHQTSGVTPFRFDRVEIRTELQPAVVYNAGGTTLSWLGRVDVDRRQLFDQEYAIARVFHCLEPRLSYRTRRRQFGIDVRVVGLEFD